MKILIVAATAGLMTLAACTPTATNNTTIVENTVIDEANAADYNATDVVTENAMPMENTTVETSNTTVTTNAM